MAISAAKKNNFRNIPVGVIFICRYNYYTHLESNRHFSSGSIQSESFLACSIRFTKTVLDKLPLCLLKRFFQEKNPKNKKNISSLQYWKRNKIFVKKESVVSASANWMFLSLPMVVYSTEDQKSRKNDQNSDQGRMTRWNWPTGSNSPS